MCGTWSQWKTDHFLKARGTFQKRLGPDLEKATNCPLALPFLPSVFFLRKRNLVGKFANLDHACTTALIASHCPSLCCASKLIFVFCSCSLTYAATVCWSMLTTDHAHFCPVTLTVLSTVINLQSLVHVHVYTVMSKPNSDPPLSLFVTHFIHSLSVSLFASSFLLTLHPSLLLSLYSPLAIPLSSCLSSVPLSSTFTSSFLHLFSVLNLLEMFPTTFSFLISILLSIPQH